MEIFCDFFTNMSKQKARIAEQIRPQILARTTRIAF